MQSVVSNAGGVDERAVRYAPSAGREHGFWHIFDCYTLDMPRLTRARYSPHRARVAGRVHRQTAHKHDWQDADNTRNGHGHDRALAAAHCVGQLYVPSAPHSQPMSSMTIWAG